MIQSICFFCLVPADTSLSQILLSLSVSSSFQDGTKVYGRCGGFCGKCVPYLTTGLPIQVTWTFSSEDTVSQRGDSLWVLQITGAHFFTPSFLRCPCPKCLCLFFQGLIGESNPCLIFFRAFKINLTGVRL